MTRTLIPWSNRLFSPVGRFEREMGDLFEHFFGSENYWPSPAGTFAPSLNLAETDAQYEVTVELPGMKPDGFSLELKDGQLAISGKVEEEKEENGKTYHRKERLFGEFRRTVSLPVPVNQEAATAEYKDGVLKVVIPKSEAVTPKRIEVRS